MVEFDDVIYLLIALCAPILGSLSIPVISEKVGLLKIVNNKQTVYIHIFWC